MTWTAPYLLIWMIGLFIAAWLSPSRRQNTVIAAAGLLFLAISAPVSLTILSFMAIFSYILADTRRKNGWSVVALTTAVIAVLVYFKMGVRIDEQIKNGSSSRSFLLRTPYYSLRL